MQHVYNNTHSLVHTDAEGFAAVELMLDKIDGNSDRVTMKTTNMLAA